MALTELAFQWPTHKSDFFPYNGMTRDISQGHYWTGYFTSRPNFKKLIRDYTAMVQSADTLIAIQTLRNMSKSEVIKEFSRT